jgi:hypothetical protein
MRRRPALGDAAGLRQETISLIENGKRATRIDTLLAVQGGHLRCHLIGTVRR